MQVLEGGSGVLSLIDSVELELSLVPLYQGQLLFVDMYTLISQQGYSLVSLEPAFADPVSGRLLQVDGVFHQY